MRLVHSSRSMPPAFRSSRRNRWSMITIRRMGADLTALRRRSSSTSYSGPVLLDSTGCLQKCLPEFSAPNLSGQRLTAVGT